MSKFFKKYKGLLIVIVAVLAFVALSILTEAANKQQTTEAYKDVTSWADNLKDEEYAVTVIALTYCSHCHNFNPVITKIANDYAIPLYWFEIDDLTEEESAIVTDTYKFDEYTGSSPYIAVTHKGEVVSEHVGEMTKSATIKFLKEAGAIK